MDFYKINDFTLERKTKITLFRAALTSCTFGKSYVV